jgi:hypothetical protein
MKKNQDLDYCQAFWSVGGRENARLVTSHLAVKSDFTFEADMDESAPHSKAWAYTTTLKMEYYVHALK